MIIYMDESERTKKAIDVCDHVQKYADEIIYKEEYTDYRGYYLHLIVKYDGRIYSMLKHNNRWQALNVVSL